MDDKLREVPILNVYKRDMDKVMYVIYRYLLVRKGEISWLKGKMNM